jgi:hypothetical protein
MPSPEAPLAGSCACGTVRFQVIAEFTTAGYCHCTRCQRRTGTPWSMNAILGASGVEVLAGAGELRTWRPPTGLSKSFCGVCGGHVFSGEAGAADGVVGVRLGALHGDPGIAPRWRQWMSSAVDWAPIPDDGLPRFDGPREID